MHPIYKFNFERNEVEFDYRFEQLVEDWRNDHVKSILKYFSSSVHWSNIVDSYGTTLLHLAAKYNNFELIDYLVEKDCDVDVKNVFDETPLLTALICDDHIEAIRSLMNANANIWSNDVQRVLLLLISKKNVLYEPILTTFMQQLRRSIEDLESLTRLLIQVECPLELVMYIADEQLTETILGMPDYDIHIAEAFSVLSYTMASSNLKNLRVLWQSDRMILPRNFILRRMIVRGADSSLKWNYIIPIFKCLTDWIVFDDDFILFLKLLLLSSDRSGLQVILQQCNIDVQIRKKYKLDILPILFANKNLNAEDLTKLTCKRQFKVDAKSFEGRRALHFAAQIESQRNLRFLLELNADCNALDECGFTPLCYAFLDNKSVELLLHYGANLHIADNDGLTVIEKMRDSEGAWEVMLSQLAIDRYRGVQIRQKILDKIYTPMFQDYYENCLKEVEHLANLEIFPYLTVFTAMTRNAKFMARQILHEDDVLIMMKQCSRPSLHWYYCSSLKSNLQKAYNMYRTKYGLAKIISKEISRPIYFDHIVIDKICDLLTYGDMRVFEHL